MIHKGVFPVSVISGLLIFSVLTVLVYAEEGQVNTEVVFEEGLSAFEDGNWPLALEKFTSVIKADPNNARARQYRGDTLLQLNQPEEAVRELEKSRNLNPTALDINLDLGQAYQQVGKLDEAEKAYREEIRNHPDNADAHFSLGYLLFIKGRYEECMPEFSGARGLDPKFGAKARFYEGAALYKLNKRDEALVAFQQVLGMSPPNDVAAGAQKYIDALKAAAPRKNWGLVLSVLYQYDTNVVAASEDAEFPMVIEDTEISHKEDSRAVVALSGYLRYAKLKPWVFEGRYSFYQSWHSKIDIFNLQNHSPEVGIYHMQKLFGHDSMVGVEYRMGYAMLGTDMEWFSVNHWGTLLYAMRWNRNLTSALGYTYNVEDFHVTQPDRDNTAHTGFGKIDYTFLKDRVTISPMAGYDDEDAEDHAYDIQRPWVKLVTDASLPLKIKSRLSFSYEYEDHYNDEMQHRKDNVYTAEFMLFRPIWGPLEATAGVSYRNNDSNVNSLTYERTIAGGGLVARF